MLDNELNSILADLEKNEYSDIPKSQNPYHTSDFSLDNILKEYGVPNQPKPVHKRTEPPKKPAETASKPKLKSDVKNLHPYYEAIDSIDKDDLISEISAYTSSAKEKSAEKKLVEKKPVEKKPVENKPVEIKKESAPKIIPETAKQKPIPVNESVEKPAHQPANGPIDLFNNEEIASSLLAHKLGSTTSETAETEYLKPAYEEPAYKEMTRIFTPEQEEDFKMRSGYIDLEAIKAATATVNLSELSAVDSKVNTADMDTSQRALFGKIGNFFSDTAFRYDTSTVNGLQTMPRKRRSAKEINEPVKAEPDPMQGDILEADDVPIVEQEMLSQLNLTFLKTIITAIISLPLAILNIFPGILEEILPSLAPSSPSNYAIANLTLLLIIAIININIVAKGIAGLFTLKPTGSSLASLSIIGSLIYSVFVIVAPPANITMFSFVSALSVLFVLIGKYIYYRNVYKNFEILAFDAPKTSCVIGDGGYSLKDLYTPANKETSCRPVSLLTHFLTNSFDSNFADLISKFAIVISVVLGIAIIVYGALTNSAQSAVSMLSLVFAVLSPFCYDMAYSLPFNMVSNKIRKTGSAVVSYSAATEYSSTDKFVLCDTDLFKPENIAVHSMKINGNEKINDVIINCASLINASCSPVSGAFLNILDNKQEMLMPVTDFDWAPGKGYSGNINSTRYFVGTSQYLADCGIKLPTIDLEEKYKRIGRQVVMFADSRKLLAVFSISYSRDEVIYKNLHKISLNDMNILVLTRDCNITSELLTQLYEMDENVFHIASKEEFQRNYRNDRPMEKYPAKIYSITGAGGITSALSNCKRLLNTVKLSVIFRTIALASAVVLLAYSVISGNIDTLLTAKNIILFHILWLIPSIFVSLFAG